MSGKWERTGQRDTKYNDTLSDAAYGELVSTFSLLLASMLLNVLSQIVTRCCARPSQRGKKRCGPGNLGVSSRSLFYYLCLLSFQDSDSL
jgi:hypothetical protein